MVCRLQKRWIPLKQNEKEYAPDNREALLLGENFLFLLLLFCCCCPPPPPNILNTEEENSQTIRNVELKVSIQTHHAERFLLMESDQPWLASFSFSEKVMEKWTWTSGKEKKKS